MPEASFDDVLVTSVPEPEERFAREHLPGARITSEPLSPELAAEHRDARVLALMIHDPIEPDSFDAFEGLEAVITRSDGYDHLPEAWMRSRSVPGYHLEGYATSSVAHHALMMTLALLRRMPEAQAMTRQGTPGWERTAMMGRHLHDVTVGVLGVGRIGSALVRLVTSLGGQALGHDIAPDTALEQIPGFRFAGSLEALLPEVDVLSVHVPLKEDTERMIGADELAALPDEAVLVNTARGDIVDQEAVEQALEADALAGYAADVLPGEPDPPDLKRFQRFDNVVLTPHLAAYDVRTTEERYRRTARIAEALIEGQTDEVEGYRVL